MLCFTAFEMVVKQGKLYLQGKLLQNLAEPWQKEMGSSRGRGKCIVLPYN